MIIRGGVITGLVRIYHLAHPDKKAVEIYRSWTDDVTLKEYARPAYIKLLKIFKKIK